MCSCLYHACAEEVYSVCLMDKSILQWSDMFTTALSIWATLITLGRLPVTIRSILTLTAVIVFSINCLYSINSALSLVTATSISILILVSTWIFSFSSTKQLFTSSKHCILQIIPGLVFLHLSILPSIFYPNKGKHFFNKNICLMRSRHSLLPQLYILATFHVGEHVLRGLSILMLLPKEKHSVGEYKLLN